MSYSFSIKAGNKADAIDAVVTQFDSIVIAQPTHEADKKAAIAAASAFIELLSEPKINEEIRVSVNGSLGWDGVNPTVFRHANVNVQSGIYQIA